MFALLHCSSGFNYSDVINFDRQEFDWFLKRLERQLKKEKDEQETEAKKIRRKSRL